MADLRIENPELTQNYAAQFAALDVELPLSVSEADTGVVLDAGGEAIFVVDVDNERPDEEVRQIAAWIVLAVNTCAGFKAEQIHG